MGKELVEEEELMAHVNTYKGLKLKIFSYFLLQPTKGVTTNEIKNVLRLKSASHASYHLNQMYQVNVLIKDPSNKYYLNDNLQVKSIKMNTLVEYFVFNNRLWPRSLLFKVYVAMVFALVLSLLFMDRLITSMIFIGISLLITSIYGIIDYRNGNSWLTRDENGELYPSHD